MGGMEHTKLSRADASAAVTRLGWRYVLGQFRTQVLTGSLPLAADVAARAAAVPDVEGHLQKDIRAARLLLSLQTAEQCWLMGVAQTTSVRVSLAELARQLSALAQEFRLTTQPGDRTVQVLELGIDALDIAGIRPRSGCWPTPRATRPASPPGRAATRASGFSGPAGLRPRAHGRHGRRRCGGRTR